MEQPPGYAGGGNGKVCRLHRALYGLKQRESCYIICLRSALTYSDTRTGLQLLLVVRFLTRYSTVMDTCTYAPLLHANNSSLTRSSSPCPLCSTRMQTPPPPSDPVP